MSVANPILAKLSLLQKLQEENEDFKAKIKSNEKVIAEIHKTCDHADEAGQLSFKHSTEPGSGANFYICTLCDKTLSWSGYFKLKDKKDGE